LTVERYADRGGSSGVAAYRIEADALVVRFKDGATYRYSVASCGAGAIADMQWLAEAGRGLNSYINRHVHDRFDARLAPPDD